MNLDFTSEQDMLRESAVRFLAKECPYDRVKELEETHKGYLPELWRKMAELGWLGLIFPEAYSGYGADFQDLVILCEEMGRAAFPSPFFSTVIQCGLSILEGGSEEQKKNLLAGIAEGSLIMALAQYEEEGSYLTSGVQMRAEPSDDQYILEGTKLFTKDANVCDMFLVAAQAPKPGLSLFLVNASDPGISVSKMPTIGKDNTCEVVFRHVRVTDENRVGPLGEGWNILRSVQAKSAVAAAAEMVGASKACIDMTSEYARQREQYKRPIGGFQIIQHYMANMLIRYDTIYNYLYQVAWMVDEGRDVSIDASALKAYANEAFKFISERAVQIHGGIGTTREADIGLFYRKAKSYEYLCGDTDFHYEQVMKGLLD